MKLGRRIRQFFVATGFTVATVACVAITVFLPRAAAPQDQQGLVLAQAINIAIAFILLNFSVLYWYGFFKGTGVEAVDDGTDA